MYDDHNCCLINPHQEETGAAVSHRGAGQSGKQAGKHTLNASSFIVLTFIHT